MPFSSNSKNRERQAKKQKSCAEITAPRRLFGGPHSSQSPIYEIASQTCI